jgi:arabinogalactan oligomer/maltooligosaccharide transport system permease protein
VNDSTQQPPGRSRELPRSRNHVVVIAILLAGLVATGLLQWILVQRFAGRTDVRISRAAMIVARAAADVVTAAGGEGPAVAPVLAAWQREHPNVRAVRVASIENRTIEASSFPADLERGELPRRMQREEKDLYDLGQALRGSVEANVSEGRKREREVEVERRKDGTILLTVPLDRGGDVVGFTQVLSEPEVVSVDAPAIWYALAFALAPFVIVLALSFVWRGRPALLVLVAAVLLLAMLFAYRQWAVKSLVEGARAAEQRFVERVERERAIAARIVRGAEAKSATWDSDDRRVPLRIDPDRSVAGEKQTIAKASYFVGALAIALLLFVGLGGATRTAANLREHRQAYLYILPAMVGMLLLVFFPFLYGIALSFTNQTIYNVNEPLTDIWVGVRNYAEILGNFDAIRHTEAGRVVNYENFYWTLFFTIAWTVVNVAIGVTVGLMLALMLNTKDLRFKTVYRVLLILPWAMPNYITALIWKGMFHQQFGVINQVVMLFGGESIAWFEKPLTSFAAVVATNGWLSFPFMMVISLGALQSIPADLYEAARVDGATRWQQFASITLPSLKPALVPAIILSVVWTFNMFNIIYLVSAGEPAHATEILITQAYKIAFEQYRYGYAAAYSTIIFAILLIYGVFQNRVTRATESIAA